MSEMRSLEEALTATYDNLDRLSPRDVSAFWAVVPKFLGGRGPSSMNKQQQQQMFHQFDLILTKSIQEIDQYGYRELATLAISLAKIIDKMSKRKGPPAEGSSHQVLQDLIGENKQFIFREIASASVPILHEFDGRSISNFIYAYGLSQEVVLVEDGSTFFDMLAEEVLSFDSLDEFRPQALSNIVWAYATANEKQPKLFEKVADQIVGLNNLHDFKPQELSNIVWACATLDEKHPRLFKTLADHIVQLDNLNDFWPQALSNIVWAFATAGESHPQLFQKLAEEAIKRQHEFIPQELANILWAYATAGESKPQLFKKLADHIIVEDLKSFNGQNLSNIVWAFATSEVPHPILFKKVAEHIVQLPNLSEFDEQHLSNIPWAFATAGESQPQLLNRLADEAIKRQHEFTSQGIANFLWAYASNGQVDEHLFSSLIPSVKDNLDKYNEQNLANVAWAYSVANVDAPSVFVFDDVFINCLGKEDGFILEDLTQLHQWQLWQDEIKSDVSLPPSLKEKCSEAFISRDPRPSKLQGDVVSTLSIMGLQPQEEVLLKSGYRIDAVVEVNGEQIAVEVDGPSHFIGRSRELTGSTILKHRQVATLDGMKVVSVPYWEWDKLKKDSKEKEKYLHSILGQS